MRRAEMLWARACASEWSIYYLKGMVSAKDAKMKSWAGRFLWEKTPWNSLKSSSL